MYEVLGDDSTPPDGTEIQGTDCEYSGRSDWIRTSDFDVPNVALYQAELRSDRGAILQQVDGGYEVLIAG